MPFILGVVFVFAAFWYWSLLRGRLLVRASTYLMHMERPGATPELCNKLAFSIDFYSTSRQTQSALHHARVAFGGHQLALISEARLRGFCG